MLLNRNKFGGTKPGVIRPKLLYQTCRMYEGELYARE
jgi:hypothetical protein